jgi:beta propeller repeat protein
MRTYQIAILLLFVAAIAVSVGAETPVTLNAADQRNPAVSGSVVVWEDHRNGNWDIYMKNLTTGLETRVSSSVADETNPDIDGSRIVYQFGVGDILLYEIGSGVTSTVVSASGEQSSPRVSNRWVVWQDHRSGSWDVYCYNLDTHAETLLTPTSIGYSPAVDGNQVVWLEENGGFATVVAYDLLTSTRTAISSGGSHPSRPDVGAGAVAYADWNPSDMKVFFRPIASGTPQQVAAADGDHDGGQAIANGRIALSGGGVSLNIWLYDINAGTATPITAGGTDVSEQDPAIDCNLVAWESNRNGNWDIYYEVVPGAAPPWAGFTRTPSSGPLPLTVRFTDTSTGATRWEWQFGDGATSTERNPMHVFYGGVYDVLQTVRNCEGYYWEEQSVYAYSPLPGRVEAENFDGDAEGWHDTTSVNSGGAYRQTGVDIEAGGSGYDVGWIAEGEWLRYQIAVPAAGSYTFTVRAAAWQPGRTIEIYVDSALMATVTTPQTGSSSTFGDVSTTIPLATDDYEVKLVFRGGSQNLDYFTVTPGSLPLVAVPGGGALPTDTNGDGKYDDVNGNGRRDFADVVLYFNQMTWIAANEPLSAFDCNGNSRIDFADVVWLFAHL